MTLGLLKYTEASGGLPNSGRLSGTVGDLVGILDVALPAAGWSIEFTATNQRVYRPGSGNRFRVGIDETTATSGDARLATFRGMEGATGAAPANWIDPFPTVAQIANNAANILKSTTANTTARNFNLYVWSTGFLLFVNISGVSNVWDFVGFADCPPVLSGDAYNTICITRNSTVTTGIGVGWNVGSTSSSGVSALRWTRSFDASVKSTTGAIPYQNNLIGQLTGAPPAQSGPSVGIDMSKAVILDSGATGTSMSGTLGLPKRGFLPFFWIPLHAGPGAVDSRDTMTNTPYNAAATFDLIVGSGTVWAIIESSDTWNVPSG